MKCNAYICINKGSNGAATKLRDMKNLIITIIGVVLFFAALIFMCVQVSGDYQAYDAGVEMIQSQIETEKFMKEFNERNGI